VDTTSGRRRALPTTLRSKLDGWIDVELDKQKLVRHRATSDRRHLDDGA